MTAKTVTSELINSLNFEQPVNSRTAAPLLGLHYKTLERMARNGDVPAARPGREWLFRVSVLSVWFDKELHANVSDSTNLTEQKSPENNEEIPEQNPKG
jgi:excisionase family DNA binding protein